MLDPERGNETNLMSTSSSRPAISVQAFLLCSAFNVSSRQFNILDGGLQSMSVEQFPDQFPLGLIIRFTMPGRPVSVVVRVEVRLGLDGELVMPPLTVDLDGSGYPDSSWAGGSTVHLPIDLTPFVVEAPGDYWFGLYVDDELITTTTLAVSSG